MRFPDALSCPERKNRENAADKFCPRAARTRCRTPAIPRFLQQHLFTSSTVFMVIPPGEKLN
jgi:hypothetical protein